MVTVHPKLTLVLGGARSGKSRYAESLIAATAQALDAEMAERIAHHRKRRGDGWHTIEEPHDLQDAIDAAPAGAAVLVDCLTLWLTNRMLAEANMEVETGRLEAALARRNGLTVLVSNEVGSGIV